jgi:hypothetical protein
MFTRGKFEGEFPIRRVMLGDVEVKGFLGTFELGCSHVSGGFG